MTSFVVFEMKNLRDCAHPFLYVPWRGARKAVGGYSSVLLAYPIPGRVIEYPSKVKAEIALGGTHCTQMMSTVLPGGSRRTARGGCERTPPSAPSLKCLSSQLVLFFSLRNIASSFKLCAYHSKKFCPLKFRGQIQNISKTYGN